MLYFDDSKYIKGGGVCIVLIDLQGGIIPMEYKLHFECINNMINNEALILVLKDSINLNINFGNSQLIIN